MNEEKSDTVEMAVELTIAWLANASNRVSSNDVPAFLNKMHDTLNSLNGAASTVAESTPTQEYTPAVSAKKSLASPDHIISMIDGKPYKTLRRHLSTNGMTPEEYRARYNLKPDYPMVAPTYSAARQEMAKRIGLGRKPGQKVAPKADAPAKAPRKNARDAAKAHLGTTE